MMDSQYIARENVAVSLEQIEAVKTAINNICARTSSVTGLMASHGMLCSVLDQLDLIERRFRERLDEQDIDLDWIAKNKLQKKTEIHHDGNV